MTSREAIYAAIHGTWPAYATSQVSGWTIRDGRGGGKRASAATACDIPHGDVETAQAAMRALGQDPLFMVRAGEDALDAALAVRGYDIVDPTNAYVTPVDTLTDIPIPRLTAYAIWEPLAIMEDIWAAGGIGPARLALMARAPLKTGIFARCREKPAGAAFVAIHAGIAMVHAVEVLQHQRRQGVAHWIMRCAAFWARENGAHTLAVLTTAANVPANALYERLGFTRVAGYHYRISPTKGLQIP